jgi:hypothetical protein
VVVATEQWQAYDILATEAWVYWTLSNTGLGQVARTPVAGGPPVVLAQNLFTPRIVTLSGGYVYFANQGDGQGKGSVMRVPEAGGIVEFLYAGSIAPYGVAVLPPDYYFTDFDHGHLYRAPLAGGPPVLLLSGPMAVVYADDTRVYLPADPQLLAWPAGGTPAVLADNLSAMGLALDATDVYAASWGNGVITRTPKGGGPTSTVVTAAAPFQVAVDDTHVYWTSPTENTVSRAAKAGGAAETLASGQGTPHFVTVNSHAVYWTNQSSGEVMKWVK